MARRSIPIEEKIEAQKEMVSKAKDKYEAELDKLEKLMKKREELRSKELMEAFANSFVRQLRASQQNFWPLLRCHQ